MWTRDLGIKAAQKIEVALGLHGAHCGMAGSVLTKGESKKDLDIIVYPHDKNQRGMDSGAIMATMCQLFEASDSRKCESSEGYKRDGKEVHWLKTKSGRRIDFFFLS